MPDRGVNAVEPETSTVDAVLTPRLAASFQRALALDEGDGGRAPDRARQQRLGPGLFDVAMASRVATAAVAIAPVDAASRRALADAARACGAARLATVGEAGAAVVVEPAGEARLARAAAMPMAELLDEAIAVTAEVAARVGDDAALAWFVAAARRIDPRVASVALGVIASLPERATSTEPTFAARFAHACEAIAARRRGIARAVDLRTSRAGAIAAAAEVARAATTAAIADELAARLREIEATRARALASVDRWHALETPLRLAEAYVARDAALAAAEHARRAAIEVAHAEHVAAIAAHHERTMAAIERAHAAYDDAVTPRVAAADALEARARDERDRAIARAESDEAAARARDAARYQARVADAERAHGSAVARAKREPFDAGSAQERAAVERRAAIEEAATAARRDAHEHAASRRRAEVDEAATAAAHARAAAIDLELASLDRIARGGTDA